MARTITHTQSPALEREQTVSPIQQHYHITSVSYSGVIDIGSYKTVRSAKRRLASIEQMERSGAKNGEVRRDSDDVLVVDPGRIYFIHSCTKEVCS